MAAWLQLLQELRRRGSWHRVGQALRDLNTKVILPLRTPPQPPSHRQHSHKTHRFDHKEPSRCLTEQDCGRIWPNLPLLSHSCTTDLWWPLKIGQCSVCCKWSSFASNADRDRHAQKGQKHGEDFLEKKLRQGTVNVSCPLDGRNGGLHHVTTDAWIEWWEAHDSQQRRR